jgi:RND family efflux transporter MFP subunit
MRLQIRTVVAIVAVVVLVIVLAKVRALRASAVATAPTAEARTAPVVVAEAREGQVATTLEEQGVLVAETEAPIAPQVMARAIEVFKREGDLVRAGEVIARLDDQELQNAHAAQVAEVAGARETAAAQAAEAARAREDIAARTADVSAAEAGMAAQLSDIDAARQTVAAQQADVEGARQTVAAQQAEVERLRENLAAAKVAAATQRSRTARDKVLYANKAIALEQWEASQTAEAQADAAVAALQRQIESVSRNVDAARQRVTALERGVDAAKQRVVSLQRGVESTRQRIASLKALVADARQHQIAQRQTAAAAGRKVTALASTAAMAATRVSYTVIRAPYDAIVTARLAEPGTLLAPGQPIYRVLRPGSVKITANVPQEAMDELRIGTPVRLVSQGQTRRASVSRLYPALSGARLGTVEIDLPTAPFGLKSGSTLQVVLEMNSRRGVVAPAGSLLESDRGQVVYVEANGQISARRVQVVARGADEIVVDRGLAPGDAVVVALPAELMALHDGQRVVVTGRKGVSDAVR